MLQLNAASSFKYLVPLQIHLIEHLQSSLVSDKIQNILAIIADSCRSYFIYETPNGTLVGASLKP